MGNIKIIGHHENNTASTENSNNAGPLYIYINDIMHILYVLV